MPGLNINPWMCFTYGKPYDTLVIDNPQAKFSLITPVTPQSAVESISQVFLHPETITDGLSPIFTTGDQHSIDNTYSRIMDLEDRLCEPQLQTEQVDYVFALSYSSRPDQHGKWALVKEIWEEACTLVLSIVGKGKTIRFWVDKIDRKRRKDRVWSWSEVYPYLAWPVVSICDTFPDRTGSRSMRMWPAMECTAGLVGHGLFCGHVPPGSGPVLQTMVKSRGFMFNQPIEPPSGRSPREIRQCYSAHVATYRFRDYATLHAQAFVDLRTHNQPFQFMRNFNGIGFYGPLQCEEPVMMSGRRHEVCSARWQPLGNRGWSNDLEWCPMESGGTILCVKKGMTEATPDPDFVAKIYGTGEHRLDQRLACVSDEQGRSTLLLLEDNGGPHGRVSSFFRYPSFLSNERAIRIAWDGPFRHLITVRRDNVQWPRGTSYGILAARGSKNRLATHHLPDAGAKQI